MDWISFLMWAVFGALCFAGWVMALHYYSKYESERQLVKALVDDAKSVNALRVQNLLLRADLLRVFHTIDRVRLAHKLVDDPRLAAVSPFAPDNGTSPTRREAWRPSIYGDESALAEWGKKTDEDARKAFESGRTPTPEMLAEQRLWADKHARGLI